MLLELPSLFTCERSNSINQTDQPVGNPKVTDYFGQFYYSDKFHGEDKVWNLLKTSHLETFSVLIFRFWTCLIYGHLCHSGIRVVNDVIFSDFNKNAHRKDVTLWSN